MNWRNILRVTIGSWNNVLATNEPAAQMKSTPSTSNIACCQQCTDTYSAYTRVKCKVRLSLSNNWIGPLSSSAPFIVLGYEECIVIAHLCETKRRPIEPHNYRNYAKNKNTKSEFPRGQNSSTVFYTYFEAPWILYGIYCQYFFTA